VYFFEYFISLLILQLALLLHSFLQSFPHCGVPFTELMAKDMWVTDFGLGDFENVGMGGIFWVNEHHLHSVRRNFCS